MKNALTLRFVWLKREWPAFLFWLVSPFIGTYLLVVLQQTLVDELTVPVGIVLEDSSEKANQLIEQLRESDYIELHLLSRTEALNQLEQHQLDSVFIIKEDYEAHLMEGKKRLIEGYASNQSYAYFAIEELVTSLVQEQATRAKLVNEVNTLLQNSNQMDLFDPEEIWQKSFTRQHEKDLIDLQVQTFENGKVEDAKTLLLSPVVIWSSLTLLSTWFLFDWIIKVRIQTLRVRWQLARETFAHYVIKQFCLFTGFFFVLDLLFFSLILHMNDLSFFIHLFVYRFIINGLICLIAHLFTSLHLYYCSGLIFVTCITLFNGSIVPLDRLLAKMPWLLALQPSYAFLQQQIPWALFVLTTSLLILYWMRGNKHATS